MPLSLTQTYKTRYGYPLHGAFIAELWWRLEGSGKPPRWWDHDGRPLAPLRRFAYCHRKQAERRYAP